MAFRALGGHLIQLERSNTLVPVHSRLRKPLALPEALSQVQAELLVYGDRDVIAISEVGQIEHHVEMTLSQIKRGRKSVLVRHDPLQALLRRGIPYPTLSLIRWLRTRVRRDRLRQARD